VRPPGPRGGQLGAGSIVRERLLIVGWDGADWEIVDDLIARGSLPNVRHMVEEGARGTLLSTIPTHSWAAWPTFLTGLEPAGHGVFDFMERHQTKLGKRHPVLSNSIGAPTFLERLSDHGLEVRAGNIPVTFPPLAIRGRMISGGAIPPGAPFVHPEEWAQQLSRSAAFPLNGMEWTRFKKRPGELIAEARSFVERRTASFRELLEGSWDVGVCVYVVTDRLQHPFGDHLIPSHPDHGVRANTELGEAIRSVYTLLDQQLGRLRDLAGPKTTLVLVSDHGFEATTRAASANAILVQHGLAALTVAGGKSKSIARSPFLTSLGKSRFGQLLRRRIPTPSLLNWSKTVAYESVTGGGVSINLRGREPEGIVDPRDYDRVREQVRETLLSFADDELGTPIADVRMREDVFTGSFAHLAPDLMAVTNPLWVLDHTDLAAARLDYPTADHRRPGVLLAAGGRTHRADLGIRKLPDLAATALAFCGVPVGRMDGVSIDQIAGAPAILEGGVRDDRPAVREDVALSDSEVESIAQHLRDLGYIE
jgi:predicted AlkP superfamily phosphohydrolase/phosphomutase